MFEGTVLTWHEVITTGLEWDQERDAPRIRAAFTTLASTRESWPTPRHFLDALPRAEQKRLGYEVKPASPEEAQARISEIRRLLREPMPTFTPEEPKAKREGPSLEAMERQLQEHYSGVDRKTQAAGGE